MKIFLFSIVLSLLVVTNSFSQDQIEKIENTAKNCTVQLKVVFLDTGKIGDVSLHSSTCNDQKLDDEAIQAGRKIKFDPQIKDGKPITVTKKVEYKFYIPDEKAEAILKKAIEKLGGEKYLNIKSQISRGKFSVLRDGAVISFQSFTDILIFPDKERTEFKGGGVKTVQTNVGDTGWVFDGSAETIREQNAAQIENFKRGIRVSLDNLLRGGWRKDGVLIYVGKRPATLGKRNDAVKLVYADGFTVEFEFSDESFPVKAIYKMTNPDNEETTEEDRYAQFIDIQGITAPFIIDRFSNGAPSSRINFESIEYNKKISDSIFNKPNSAKEAKKDVKF